MAILTHESNWMPVEKSLGVPVTLQVMQLFTVLPQTRLKPMTLLKQPVE